MSETMKILWNGKELWKKLIAENLGITSEEVVVKEHFFHSYITAYTSKGEYKVDFVFISEKGTYIKSIVKVTA